MSKRAYTAAVVNSFDPEREGENSPCSTGEKVRYLERLGLLRVLHVVNRARGRRGKVTVLHEIAVSSRRVAAWREEGEAVELVFFYFSQAWENGNGFCFQ